MIAALALLIAVAIDAQFGEPPNAIHPVAWLGALIARGRDWAFRAGRTGQFLRGAWVALAIPLLAGSLAWGSTRALGRSGVLLLVATALLLKPLFAVRALGAAAFVVRDALAEGNVAAARVGLSSLCSRKADELDEPALIAATVESIAENASDSIVAPIFYFALAGLPGAAVYRACNTLDAMIGYRGRYEWVGKTAARLDDLLNLVPARLTALLFLLAAPIAGGNALRGARAWWRDGRRTESPNAGRPMATMAGILGVRLEKIGHYALGDDTRALECQDITRAWRVVLIAAYTGVAIVVAILVSWSTSRV
jgi:adenosylcobinamide-phosphate synthase